MHQYYFTFLQSGGGGAGFWTCAGRRHG